MQQQQETTSSNNNKNLQPPSITLRPFNTSDSDVEAFMSWATDPRVVHFQRREPYTTKEQALHYIKDHIMPHPWYRAICIDNRPVGSISVKPGPGDEQFKASIGYRIAFEYWGRGITTAALKEVVTTVFKDWPQLERLEAIADVENLASQRVLEKAGFKREGVLRKYIMLKGKTRDMVMFSFLVEDDVFV